MLQNTSCMKSWIEGQRIHQLGIVAYSVWIGVNLTKLALLPSWWILYPSIQDFMQNLFVTPAIFFHPANFLLKGFAISLKILSAYCVLFDHNQDLFTLLTIQINIFVGRDKRMYLGGEVFDDHNLNAMKIFNHESTQFGTYRIKCNNHLLHMQSGVWYGSIISCCARAE